MSSARRRIAKLELQRPDVFEPVFNKIVGTQLIATDDAALVGSNTTEGTLVTFYNQTLALAYVDRLRWLEGAEKPKNGIVLVCPQMDNGKAVLSVIAERHNE